MQNKQRKDIDRLICKSWKAVYEGVQVIKKEIPEIVYNEEAKELFGHYFNKIYCDIAKGYMRDINGSLDRHKVAAIIIISIIKSNVLKCDKKVEGKVFFGNYVLATDAALSYMIKDLNKRLEDKEKSKVENYFFPKAMSCPTNYYRIFYRNLYYADNNKEWGLNPLDLAERLFLLEYITLEKNGIDPSVLNEY